ncbi:LysM peptidoglycan-binding domain-containing protein [bacterium]|nr:LysM peptidoglycan-binding domain-containing protein [bacterium]
MSINNDAVDFFDSAEKSSPSPALVDLADFKAAGLRSQPSREDMSALVDQGVLNDLVIALDDDSSADARLGRADLIAGSKTVEVTGDVQTGDAVSHKIDQGTGKSDLVASLAGETADNAPLGGSATDVPLPASVSDERMQAALSQTYRGQDLSTAVEPARVTFEEGDNPWKIARRHLGEAASNADVQKHVEEIMRLNGISDPRRLRVGTELMLPGHTEDGGFVNLDEQGNRTTHGRDGSVRIDNTDGSGRERRADGSDISWRNQEERRALDERNQEGAGERADQKDRADESDSDHREESGGDSGERAEEGSVSDAQVQEALENQGDFEDIRRETEPEDYTVKKGDNLWNIAKRHLGEGASNAEIWNHVEEIARLNEIENPSLLREGDEIRLPGHDAEGNTIIEDRDGNRTTHGRNGSIRIDNRDGSGYERQADGSERRWSNSDVAHDDGQHQDGQHQDGQHQDGQHQDGHHQDGQHQDGQHQDGKHQDGQHQDGQHQDGQHQDGQHQDGKHQDGKHQDDKHQDGQHQDGQHQGDDKLDRPGVDDLSEHAEIQSTDAPDDAMQGALDAARERMGENSPEFEQFQRDAQEFARRTDVSREEIRRSFEQVERMLTADSAVLSQQDRNLLAQNFMHHAKDPSNIDQGHYNTCNATTMQERLFSKDPSKAAEILATTAINGSWKAPDGKKIKIDPASLVPMPESRTSPPADGTRSFATQVLNNVLINDILQRRSPPQTYSQLSMNADGTPLAPGDNGERLYEKDGSEVRNPDGSFYRSPGVFSGEMSMGLRRLTGDKRTVISNPASDPDKNLTHVRSAEELGKTLEQMQRDGKLPAIILVDADHPSFGGSGDGTPGWHVVTIRGYDPETGEVQISNQWGSAYDRPMSLDDLFASTTDHSRQSKGARESTDGFQNTGSEIEFENYLSEFNKQKNFDWGGGMKRPSQIDPAN